jgi:hypothetical protein
MQSLTMVLLYAGLCLSQVMFPQSCFAQLQGIVDLHAHCDPDSAPRSIDALQLAKLARQEGMRALLLKNHYAPTAQLAYIVAHAVDGIQTYGGIVLNRSVGGVNPAAVEQMAKFKGGYGRVVWMPTFDAENAVRFAKENRPFVSVSRNGSLLPEVVQVIGLIAREKLALATGHSLPDEDLMLIREARKAGITRIVVTHPAKDPIHMSIDQMREAAKLGALLEFDYSGVLPASGPGRPTIASYVKAIHALGAEHCVISSDLGQPGNPIHTDGWKAYLAALRKEGISDAEINLMAKQNPARVLALE